MRHDKRNSKGQFARGGASSPRQVFVPRRGSNDFPEESNSSQSVPKLHAAFAGLSQDVSADKPLWPSSRKWQEAAATTNLPEDCLPTAKKTYNAHFITAWKRKFSENPDGPSTEKEAYEWRDACEREARAAIAGAQAVPASQVVAGMTVRNASPRSYGEQKVWSVVASNPVWGVRLDSGGWLLGRTAREDPAAEQISRRVLLLRNGHTMEFTDDRTKVIYFPAL